MQDYIGLAQDREKNEGSLERGNKLSGAINCRDVPEWLCNWWSLQWC
jgi:hypothetical protein